MSKGAPRDGKSQEAIVVVATNGLRLSGAERHLRA
jgi:hypothetical protein